MCIYSFSFLCLPIVASVWARTPTASSAAWCWTVSSGAELAHNALPPSESPRSFLHPPGLPCAKKDPSSGLSVSGSRPHWTPCWLQLSHFIGLRRNMCPCFQFCPFHCPRPQHPAQCSALGLSHPFSKVSLGCPFLRLRFFLCSL